MKLIIDIPEDEYNEWGKNIKNAIPIPDNATNGEVIRAMFPNSEYEILYNTVFTEIDNGLWFTLDWWNSLYQKGGK